MRLFARKWTTIKLTKLESKYAIFARGSSLGVYDSMPLVETHRGELLGDPLDVKMFGFTKWNLLRTLKIPRVQFILDLRYIPVMIVSEFDLLRP